MFLESVGEDLMEERCNALLLIISGTEILFHVPVGENELFTPLCINPYPAKLMYLNFHPLEVVSRYRDPQLQVGENFLCLFNLSTTFCTHFISGHSQ